MEFFDAKKPALSEIYLVLATSCTVDAKLLSSPAKFTLKCNYAALPSVISVVGSEPEPYKAT